MIGEHEDARKVTEQLVALLKYAPLEQYPFLLTTADLLETPASNLVEDDLTTEEGMNLVMDQFGQRFRGVVFVERDGDIIPTEKDAKKVIHVHPWLDQEAQRIGSQIALLQEQLREIKSIERKWKKYERIEKFLLQSPIERSLKLVASVFNSQENKELSADGEDTNASLTQQSARKLCEALREFVGVTENDSVMDGGAACNYTLASMAQILDVNVVGVEYVDNRVFLGAKSHLKMLDETEECWWIPDDFNRRIAYAMMDLFHMKSFNLVTILYIFDEGTLTNEFYMLAYKSKLSL